MLERIGLFNLAQNVAQHASDRQQVIARNVANADTPGYKARDLTPFTTTQDDGFAMRQTSARHLGSGTAEAAWRSFETQGPEDPNGNSVNLEEEVLRSVEASRAHNRALTIYNTSLQILRSSIGRGG